ncbi:ABC transporter substrate-binding protein [Paraglaciecola sp. L1A13]|uniref:ABC transporter substrate-binding protein n=1 Tax=Paraglaciecola sp. L1A13 TaxID=2686359 RepID=UPI00131BAFD9|nr:ABC transporter substrate-binding protein [Paraglaciecola sp. L1A13]
MIKIIWFVWGLCCYIGIATNVSAAQTLSVAVLTTSENQSDVYRQVFDDFETKSSKFRIKLAFFNDNDFKRLLPSWLETGEYDLLYWQGGQRLRSLIAQDVIQPIDTLLPKAELQKALQPAVLNSVTNETGTYALPLAQYGWGFYYNKSVFKELNVRPPKTWSEFVTLCRQIKNQGASPLVQAIQESWPLLAWLDYLSVDVGGTAFRQQLINASLLEQQNASSLIGQFNQLLGQEWFLAPERRWTWQQAIKVVENKQAAMTLMGQFAESTIDSTQSENIGFFPFPKAREDNHSEVAPLELWVVPRSAKNKAQLTDLLRFLLNNNASMAIGLGSLPVTTDSFSEYLPSERMKTSAESLAQSDTLLQFFDRDADAKISLNAARSFAKSIHDDNSESLVNGVINGAQVVYDMNTDVDTQQQPQLYFSSITGMKETFFASNLMQSIYRQLGYDITITRFTSIAASLNSYRFGSDGELMRVDAYSRLSPSLLRIPEPLTNITFYLVCKNLDMCSSSLSKGSDVFVTSELLVVKDWAAENHVNLKRYNSVEALFNAFNLSENGLLVLGASEIIDNSSMLSESTYRTIISVPLYHYVHNKHKELVPLINNALKQYKTTEQYQALKQRYWLQHN